MAEFLSCYYPWIEEWFIDLSFQESNVSTIKYRTGQVMSLPCLYESNYVCHPHLEAFSMSIHFDSGQKDSLYHLSFCSCCHLFN